MERFQRKRPRLGLPFIEPVLEPILFGATAGDAQALVVVDELGLVLVVDRDRGPPLVAGPADHRREALVDGERSPRTGRASTTARAPTVITGRIGRCRARIARLSASAPAGGAVVADHLGAIGRRAPAEHRVGAALAAAAGAAVARRAGARAAARGALVAQHHCARAAAGADVPLLAAAWADDGGGDDDTCVMQNRCAARCRQHAAPGAATGCDS